jgi:thioredoxin-related protein
MKKLILILLCLPLIGLTQSTNNHNSINWLELSEAERLSEKSNKNMLLFFYRENCEYCEKMKSQTFTDPSVIGLINDNFLPVMINGKSKDPIIYNKKEYENEKPNPKDAPYFHNLFKELVDMKNENYYWPTIVIVNGKKKKIIQGSGFWPKEQTLRNLGSLLK